VIHSFWVPEFLFKRDVFPMPEKNDQRNVWRIDKIDREGAFVGRCAELCGAYHSRMLFDVKVVSEDEYKSHLERLQQQGNIGPALGGSEVDQQSGLEQKVQDNDQSTGAGK
jgi:cytochrome c oxidase subunit II